MQYRYVVLSLALVACGDSSSPPLNGTPDGGVPDAGDLDAGPPGNPDAGNPDAGNPDSGTPDGPTQPTVYDPAVGSWSTAFTLPGASGFGSRVSTVQIARDGSVYIGGIFDNVTDVVAHNVAHWTGTDWEPLGAGLESWVRALRFDASGALWAVGGEFQAGRVWRWDGTAWTLAAEADGRVVDMAVVGSDLVIVGEFATVAGVAARGVARHDADGWHAIGAGTADAEVISAVAAADTGFCVAGQFASIDGVAAQNAACWSGTAWTPLGKGLEGGVAVLARSPSGAWFAGGTLSYVNEFGELLGAGVATLSDTGTWGLFHDGIDNGTINQVRGIAFDGDDVIVTGCFRTAGVPRAITAHVARWSPGVGWSEVAGGLSGSTGVFALGIEGGHALALGDDGALWVGGFYTTAGTTPASHLLRLPRGGKPTSVIGPRPVLGIGGYVDGVAASPDGKLIAVGDFNYAGLTPSTGLSRFDGATWTDLSDGLAGWVRDVIVLENGTIAVAGFLVLNAEPIAFAQRDASGWTTPGGAVHGQAFTLLERDGVLWIGGDLSDAGGVAVSNLARFDGKTWAAAGGVDGRVTALAALDGKIVAGGLFETIDGATTAGLARWDGAAWTAFPGGGVDGYVNALAASPKLGLVVAGSFRSIGGMPASGIARFDGAWHDVGGGVTEPKFFTASALRAYGDGVFFAGGFSKVGATAAENIAWFDGAAWHALGGGLGDLSESMVVIDHTLYVGGVFSTAGESVSVGVAAWTFEPRP